MDNIPTTLTPVEFVMRLHRFYKIISGPVIICFSAPEGRAAIEGFMDKWEAYITAQNAGLPEDESMARLEEAIIAFNCADELIESGSVNIIGGMDHVG